MKHSSLGFFLVAAVLIASCSSSSGGGSGSGAGGASGTGGAGICVELTVENVSAWCSVSINGATTSSVATQTVCLPSGSVTLAASPLGGFKLGSPTWHGTSNDTGTTSGSTSSATVTLASTPKRGYECCP